jgi:Holliday junction resolvasome RuvABC endonuclease subunit
MPKILTIDNGKVLGFALLEGAKASSGSFKVLDTWTPLGEKALIYERFVRALIEQHRPDVIGTAAQFVSRFTTTDNGVPLFWAFGCVLKLAAELGIRSEIIIEAEARRAILGEKMPKGSKAKKRAVWQACLDRGWRCTNYDASDALCIALAVQERLQPKKAHQTTPLFIAAGARPKGRKKAA